MIHINKFIDKIKAQELRGGKDFIMTLREAKDLHGDITKLLLHLQQTQMAAPKESSDEVIQIEIAGDKW